MKSNLITTINNAIDNGTELVLSMCPDPLRGHDNAITTSFIPDAIDVGENGIIVYAKGDIYSLDTTRVIYDEVEEVYACIGTSTIASIETA